MAIRNTTGERAFDAFVESPTRPDKTAVEVYVGNPGDIGGGGGGGPINTTPEVHNVPLVLADTEYSFALPNNCRGFVFKPQTVARISLAYQSGGPWYNCGLGSGFIDNNRYTNQTIYLKSNVANTTIDLITYK